MEDRDYLITKKRELEQMICNKLEEHSLSSHWGTEMTSYSMHPADKAAQLQTLSIELEKINEILAQKYPGQFS